MRPIIAIALAGLLTAGCAEELEFTESETVGATAVLLYSMGRLCNLDWQQAFNAQVDRLVELGEGSRPEVLQTVMRNGEFALSDKRDQAEQDWDCNVWADYVERHS